MDKRERGSEDPRIRNLTKTMMLCAADDAYLAGLAGQPGQPGLVGLAGQTVLTGPTALPDPMYEFAAKFLERRVGLSREDAVKIARKHGLPFMYEAQRHPGLRRGKRCEDREVRGVLESLIPKCTDEVYEQLAVYLLGLHEARDSAMSDDNIRSFVDACSWAQLGARFRVNYHDWPLLKEKLLDSKVTLERVLACIAAGDVMGVFGPDELEELRCVTERSRADVAGMLLYVASASVATESA